MRSAAFCLTLLVAVSAAWAKPAAQTPFAAASKAMAEGDFEKALATLDAALPKTTDPAEVAKLQLKRGECLIALGKKDKAAQAFKAALAKDAAIEPDRKRVSPDVVDFFEATRASVPGVVSITVKNGEATVRVDDRPLGPAPLTLELTAGAHKVTAQASDGKVASANLDVVPARKATVELELAAPVVEAPKPAPVADATKTPAADTVPPPPPPQVEQHPSSSLRTPGWVTLGGGVVVGAAGAVFLVMANQRYSMLTSGPGPIEPGAANAAVSDGKLFQPLGWAGIGVGAAAIVAGVVMVLLPGSSATVGALITPDGTAWVSYGGRLPW